MSPALSPGELARLADPDRYYAVTPGGDLSSLRGDLHHLLNPWIGILRHAVEAACGLDPVAVPYNHRDGATLPAPIRKGDTVGVDLAVLVGIVQTMQVATELADFAVGEEPMRVQLAAMHEEIAAGRARSPWREAPEGLEPHDLEGSGLLCARTDCGFAPGHPIHHGGSS